MSQEQERAAFEAWWEDFKRNFDPSRTQGSLYRQLAFAGWQARAQQPSVIPVQEAWEAAGGNPGIKATKEDLLEALRQLDRVCDEADAQQPSAEPSPKEKD